MENLTLNERAFDGPDAWYQFARARDWKSGESVTINGQRYVVNADSVPGINRFESISIN